MSATDKADFEVGAVAHVSFRVRCENLSHGEEVYLVSESDLGRQVKVRARAFVRRCRLFLLFIFSRVFLCSCSSKLTPV